MEIIVNESGVRIDKFISDNVEELSRSFVANLAAEGRITLKNGTALNKNYKTREGDVIVVDIPEPEVIDVLPENIPLNIVYEDDDLLVINKPQGMVVHPAPGNYSGTLVNALMYHCEGKLSAINGAIRPGIVHRIDKDTSGLLVVAKTNNAHLSLSEQIKEKKAVRRYYALLNGVIKENGTVDKPIGRHPVDRKKMAVVTGGRDAVTHFNVLKMYDRYTLTECILETGRTHQIRVHMASIGHSVVGDKTYGKAKEEFKLAGQLLHAKTIGFNHPATGEYMEFSSDIPEYFSDIINKLDKRQK